MLTLTHDQDIKLMSKIRKLIHDFNNGKLEVNFSSLGFGYYGKGYQHTFKNGLLRWISIEERESLESKFYKKYEVRIVLNDKSQQKHTFYLMLDKETNRVVESI